MMKYMKMSADYYYGGMTKTGVRLPAITAEISRRSVGSAAGRPR